MAVFLIRPAAPAIMPQGSPQFLATSRAAITDATVGAWVISVLNKNGVPIVPLRAEFGRGKTSAAGRHDAGHEKGKLHNHPPLVSEMARMVDRVDCGSIALFQGSA